MTQIKWNNPQHTSKETMFTEVGFHLLEIGQQSMVLPFTNGGLQRLPSVRERSKQSEKVRFRIL